MNVLVFILFLVGGVVLERALAYRARPRSRTVQGSVPGYSFTSGSEVDKAVMGGQALEVLSVEEFHTPDRTRIVFTVLSDLVDRGFCQVLATTLQARVHAQVVLVEVRRSNGERLSHLFAADGRGWFGKELVGHLQV